MIVKKTIYIIIQGIKGLKRLHENKNVFYRILFRKFVKLMQLNSVRLGTWKRLKTETDLKLLLRKFRFFKFEEIPQKFRIFEGFPNILNRFPIFIVEWFPHIF